MKKLFFVITTCVLFSGSFIFAKSDNTHASEKLNVATKDLISCHVEFAKASIDRKCEKLKKKIRKFEEQLRSYETYSNQIDAIELSDRRTELLNKIQKYEERVYNLKLLKSSTEIVDFTDLN